MMTDEEIVEAMARTMPNSDMNPAGTADDYRHMAVAAFNAAKPAIRAQMLEEMREPSEVMRKAAWKTLDGVTRSCRPTHPYPVQAWQAMLDAFIAEREGK